MGLVGGIGAGKSQVAQILESLGAAVIDSDRMTHEELCDPKVIATLRRWWGGRVCTEEEKIDRRAVGAIVFDDPAELARLEQFLYPRLARRRDVLIASYNLDPSVRAIVLDAPKLYEVGLHEQCDSIIYVEADRATRLQRVAAARGWTGAELDKREKLLKPLDMKKAIADHLVVNHSNIHDLRSSVERVFS